jgi:hypothetical protein
LVRIEIAHLLYSCSFGVGNSFRRFAASQQRAAQAASTAIVTSTRPAE